MRPAALAFIGFGLAAALAAAPAVRAEGTGGGAAPYLRAGAGARGLAMGNAQTAAVEDAAAAYWNPAALTQLGGFGLASQLSVLGDERAWGFVNVCQGGEAAGIGHFGYGLTWISFSAGNDLEARQVNRPDPDALFSDAQNAYLLSGAADFGSRVALGLTLKLISHALNGETASGFGFDLALWQPIGDWAWGLMLQDAYTALDWAGRHTDRLPTLSRAGLVWHALPQTLTLGADAAAEWSHVGQEFSAVRFRIGAEYRPWQPLAVRAGWDGDRLTGGVGANVAFGEGIVARLDYALAAEQLPGTGPSHAISLVMDFRFGAAEPARPEP